MIEWMELSWNKLRCTDVRASLFPLVDTLETDPVRFDVLYEM